LLVLTLVVAFVWSSNHGRLSLDSWGVPVDYYEDSQLVISWIRAAADGDFVPFLSKDISRLGAPYQANWNDWPVSGEWMIVGIGLLARWVGLLPACNLGLVLGYITSALGFYACCRLLRLRREWSLVGAVLFAFAYFHAYRDLHHLLHSYSYLVPFQILTAWLITFGRRLRWGNKFSWLCLCTATASGMTNPYNLNMLAQFICLGLVVQFFTRRSKPNLQIGVTCLGLIVVTFVVINADTFLCQAEYGKNTEAMQRGYYETELFALKPLELLVPPVTHNSAFLAGIGSKYVRDAWLKGELFSPYLGIVGIAGLVWMVVETLRLMQRNRRTLPARRFPAHIPFVSWIFLYSAVGGLNCVIALAGYPLFRGSNRYSIFISALILFFLVSRASRLTRLWTSGKCLIVGGIILAVGLYDQLPQQMPGEMTQYIARNVETDRSFAQAMESKLPAKSMVFQLPVMTFPESTAVNNLQGYELLRPYYFTKTLRFSFGSNKGRAREDWQKDVEKLSASQLVATLEKYGFGAIYLNRKGFADSAEGLIKQLAEAGRTQIIEDSQREQVCIILNPSATPELPPRGNRASLTYDSGWVAWPSTPSGVQFWAGGDATASFYTPRKNTDSYVLNGQIASLTPRHVSLLCNGKEVWSANLGANQMSPINVRLDARSGRNKLEFATDIHERPSKLNPLPRSFVFINPTLRRETP
jgi:hypothetical protein